MVREVTAGLTIPEEVDDLMREHIRFLYREGMFSSHPLFVCSTAAALQFLRQYITKL